MQSGQKVVENLFKQGKTKIIANDLPIEVLSKTTSDGYNEQKNKDEQQIIKLIRTTAKHIPAQLAKASAPLLPRYHLPKTSALVLPPSTIHLCFGKWQTSCLCVTMLWIATDGEVEGLHV